MSKRGFRFLLFLLLLCIGLLVPAGAYGQAIVPGFDSNTLDANDDGSTGLVDIGFTINFFGIEFEELYINNNGNVTFDNSLSTFTPFDLNSTTRQIIAPFFADVDTRVAGEPVTYGPGTFQGRPAFGVNWINVDYYFSSSNNTNRNSFQLILVNRSDTGAGNFDIVFNYDQIQWEAGTASGGDSSGRGGNSARAGYSNGTQLQGSFYELPGSAVNGAFLDGGPYALTSNSHNSDVNGRYIYRARAGSVGLICWAENMSASRLNTPIPSFEWTYRDSNNRAMQQYHVQVRRSSDNWLLWDSGPVEGNAAGNGRFEAKYKGPRLEPVVQYRFRVRVSNGSQWSSWFEHSFAITQPVIYNPYEGVNWNRSMYVQLHAHYLDDTKREYTGRINYEKVVSGLYALAGYRHVFLTEHSGPEHPDSCDWLPDGHVDKHRAVECTGSRYHMLALGINELVTPWGLISNLSPDKVSLQKRVDQIVTQNWHGAGALAIPAHPNSSIQAFGFGGDYSWPLERLSGTKRYQAMEIYTGAQDFGVYRQHAFAVDKWQQLLQEGHVVWGVATDDYTPGPILGHFGPDKGAVVIPYRGSAPDKPEVLNLIRQGAFYATTGTFGPAIHEIKLTHPGGNPRIEVRTTPLSRVKFVSDRGVEDTSWTWTGNASYNVQGHERFVRVEVLSDVGSNISWAQPILFSQTGSGSAVMAAGESGGVSLHRATVQLPPQDEAVTVRLQLPSGEMTPASAPPDGMVGQPYYLDSDRGGFAGPANLIIDYDYVIPYHEPALAVYYLAKGDAPWTKLPTVLDRDSGTALARAESHGWYVLSVDRFALMPASAGPSIAVTSPGPGAVLDDHFTVSAQILEDTGIWKMDFYLADILLGYDNYAGDGWSLEVDPDFYAAGAYTLKVVAEDLDGNTAEAQVEITLAGGTQPPGVSILSPAPGVGLGAGTTVEGTYSSEHELAYIVVGVGDGLLAEAQFAEGAWSCAIPGGTRETGSYTLWAEARDIYGNKALAEISVHVGPTLRVFPPENRLSASETRELVLLAGGLAGNLGSAAVTLGFDPDQLEILEVREGDYLSSGDAATSFEYTVDGSAGLLEINIQRQGAAPGSGGHLAYITLRAKPGASSFLLNDLDSRFFDAAGEPLHFSYAGAAFTVNSPPVISAFPPEKTISAHRAFSLQLAAADPDGDNLVYELVGMEATPEGMSIDPSTGLITWPEPVPGTYAITAAVSDGVNGWVEASMNLTAVLYGKVRGSGPVDVGDAITVLRYVIGMEDQLEPLARSAADVNGNGRIDTGDAVLILRFVLGLIDRFPVEE